MPDKKKTLEDKYNQLQSDASSDLKKLYPNKKTEIRSSGFRNPETQSGIVSKGSSITDVSLHSLDAARDYQIYINDKLSNDSELYHNVLWKNAEKNDLNHLDPKGFGATDLGHIGAVKEDGKTTFTRLLEKYPEIKDKKEYGELTDFLKNKKRTKKEESVYNQLTGNLKNTENVSNSDVLSKVGGK